MIRSSTKDLSLFKNPSRCALVIFLLFFMAACATSPAPPGVKGKKGLTWGLVSHSDNLGIDRVGCYGIPRVDGSIDGQPCDPYQGDTSCSMSLPILCLKPENLPRPNYAVAGKGHAMPAEYYNGWTGGHIGLTQPVRGDALTSVQAGNELCKAELGDGYRMAEHHDGKYVRGMNENNYYGKTWPSESRLLPGGWHWYAYGNISGTTRFWVYINDQQQGNCWDNRTLPADLLPSETGISGGKSGSHGLVQPQK